jgi:phosphonate transport system ATP-binding protein
VSALVAELRDVTVRYGGTPALDAVSLTVRAGERVGLVGASGAGKSTLLGVLNGLVPVDAGTVTVLGCDPAVLRGRELRRHRARIGTVHQHLDLVGPLRVVHNVNAGRLADWSLPRAVWSLLRPQGVPRATGALAAVGLADRVYDRVDTLSGGQRQRVAVARVLVQAPELVLADEPVSALDPAWASQVLDLVTGGGGARTVLASLHDVALARRHCSRLVGLSHGRVVFDAPAAEVSDERLHELFSGTSA